MSHVPAAVRRLDAELPHFADGRIDYRGAAVAAVLACFVEWSGKILLLKRSDRVGTYSSLWSMVTGYLDEPKPIEDKVRAELLEELGIELDSNASIKCGEPYEFRDDLLKRTWILHPVLISLQEVTVHAPERGGAG
jgi:8-oxo-dGTP pyrophosphatase MutT (NUDIX family)